MPPLGGRLLVGNRVTNGYLRAHGKTPDDLTSTSQQTVIAYTTVFFVEQFRRDAWALLCTQVKRLLYQKVSDLFKGSLQGVVSLQQAT